jgi:hypothetical protein
MRIIVFGYNNFDGITTSKFLEGIPHILLTHTKEQKESFIKSGNLAKSAKVIHSGKPKGLSYNRNYALSLLKDGEWCMFWVDDLIDLTWNRRAIKANEQLLNIDFKNQNKHREDFKVKATAKEFVKYCEELTKKADAEGVYLVGFSCTDNPMFRRKRFNYHSFADGRCYLIKKSRLRFDENVHSIDDMALSALNLKHFGKLIVDNWVLPRCKRYVKGVSYGGKDERMQLKFKECAYLVKTYPQYIRIMPKAGWPLGTHVRLVYHPKKSVTKVLPNGYTQT